jgi:hypothetical protein
MSDTVVKRGRGRPKGSKNKVKKAVEAEVKDTVVDDVKVDDVETTETEPDTEEGKE